MLFAANCPEDCPPSDASPAVGIVLRFVRRSPVHPDELRTLADIGKFPERGDACLRCGISVLVSWSDVEQARATIPVFRKRQVATATLGAEHGRLKQTGSNAWHHSLWLERGCAPAIHGLFSVVEQ